MAAWYSSNILLDVERIVFSRSEQLSLSVVKLLPGFLRTVENVNIYNFVTPKWCMGKYFSK